MNQDIKERWVAALRSGEYKQGKDRLRLGNSFCCLGVLCEIAVEDGIIEAPEPSGKTAWGERGHSYEGQRYHLPEAVISWAGLESENPSVEGKMISDHNDDGASFPEIANLIEEHL